MILFINRRYFEIEYSGMLNAFGVFKRVMIQKANNAANLCSLYGACHKLLSAEYSRNKSNRRLSNQVVFVQVWIISAVGLY